MRDFSVRKQSTKVLKLNRNQKFAINSMSIPILSPTFVAVGFITHSPCPRSAIITCLPMMAVLMCGGVGALHGGGDGLHGGDGGLHALPSPNLSPSPNPCACVEEDTKDRSVRAELQWNYPHGRR